MAKRKSPGVGIAEDVQPTFKEIARLVDAFCRDHLNEEYAELCRRLTETLARKQPSPLVKGKPKNWACGIVRSIGWVNCLDEKSQTPYMRLIDIDARFGVGKGYGSAKQAAIREMLNITPSNCEWTLPSRIHANPLIWIIPVNGFMIDIRHSPRNVQESAFNKGLIPYIHADRQEGV